MQGLAQAAAHVPHVRVRVCVGDATLRVGIASRPPLIPRGWKTFGAVNGNKVAVGIYLHATGIDVQGSGVTGGTAAPAVRADSSHAPPSQLFRSPGKADVGTMS